MKHVGGLDGLRGAAVAGVLVFHANAALRGGYLGVDLFFVLSGFLITSILVDEHAARGSIDLKNFWVRRARRLLPALLSLMPAIALYAKTLAAKSELASLRADALATLAYVANWRAIFAKRSYWEMFAAPSPLEHTWSLAIEEQFYVVWPLVVAAVLGLARGRSKERALLALCIVLALASCASMFFLYEGGDTTRVYLGTDTRGVAILIGAAFAASGLAKGETAPAWLDGLGLVALAGVGVAWARLDGESPFLYRGGFWLTEIGAVIIVACCVRRPLGVVSTIFSLAPLRALGVISYGVYLWHWPLYVVLTEERVHFGGVRLFALRIAATLVVAIVSYRFLERPIRVHGLRWGRPFVLVPSAFVLAAVFVLAATRNVDAEPQKNGASASASANPLAVPKEIKFPPVNMFPPAAELPPNATRVLVLGDSVAMSLGSRMYWVRRPDDAFVVQRAVGDCSILEGIVPVHAMSGTRHGNGNCARDWVDDVKELEPDVTMVLLGGAFFSTVKIGSRWRMVCEAGWHDAYVKRLSELLDAMAPHSKRRIVLTAPYPVGKWESPALAEKVDCYNQVLRDAAAASHGTEVLDLAEELCPARNCTLVSHDDAVRYDGLHFGGTGADDIVHWVLDSLKGSRTPSSADKTSDAGSP